MDRVRDARRGAMTAVSNGGVSRRRQRNSSLRDSPEEDGPGMELTEMGGRLRERPVKKERERERDRERDRELREREREREHDRERDRSSRSKRRKGEMRVPQGGGHHRDDGGDETTDESMGDEDDDDDDMGSAAMTRLPPPPPMLNHHHHHHHPSSATSFPSAAMGPSHHRKSFPPKIVRAVTTPVPVPVKTTTDEIIHFTVPRKARSASVKRSHELWSSAGGGGSGDPALRQPTTSPARPSSSQAPAAAPISPSSPNTSVKKKLKHATPGKQHHHHRPPKNTKAAVSSSIQDEIEIEVAEVLYGLKTSSKEVHNPKDSYDAKSRVSSPSATIPPVAGSASGSQNTLSMANSSTTVIAPKRKKPRPVKYDEEIPATAAAPFSTPNTSTITATATVTATKSEAEATSSAISSPKLEKTAAAPSAGENAGKSELTLASAVVKVSEVAISLEVTEAKDKGVAVADPQFSSHAKLESDVIDSSTAPPKSLPAEPVVESAKVEKFKIDLMAPPSTKSSPERDGIPDFMVDQKSMLSVTEVVTRIESVKTDEKEKVEDRRPEDRKVEAYVEAQKVHGGKLRTVDLQMEFDQNQGKYDDGSSKKQPSFNHKAPSKVAKGEPSSVLEKPASQSSSVTAISMAMGGWPGGLPPMGYMGQVPPIPVPSIVPLSGNSAPSTTIQPPYFLLGQSRPKRCATHFYIAQNIHYHEQLARLNPFWPPGAGSAPIYGSKPYNLNVVPPSESAVLGNQLPVAPLGGRSTTAQDKTPVASFPGQQPKEKISSPAVMGANLMDANQRKQQFVLQQGPQHGSANNMLGPTFIFPLNQQQAAAATARSSSVKSNAPVNNGAPAANGPNPVPGAVASSVSAAPPATMSFNFANMAPNEAQAQAQYLAILQNGGYPFPIPAHVGAPPSYRGSHPHPVPFFNGSFFSSQMLHPSQLQQQQQSQTQPATPPVGHHTSTSSGSSSSQKQQQQHRAAPGMANSGGQTGTNNFPSVKPRPPMSTHQLRQFDSESGVEESPSAGDNRASHAQKNAPVVYNHNFGMPNFALLSPAAMAGHGDKNQQQQLPPNLKGGMELGPSQFAMSFASPAGLDFSAVAAPNHPLFQSLPDAARHQMAAAAAAAAQAAVAQQKKTTFPSAEESKAASDSLKQHPPSEEDRKRTSSSGPLTRADAIDPSVSGNSGLEGSNRTLNLNLTNGSQNSRVSTGASTSATSTVLTPAMGNYLHQHMQKQHLQKHQQEMQKQQQQHLQGQPQMQHQIVGRSKPNASSHSPAYPDRLAGGGKFQNTMSAFPPALMQQTNSPNQSPQWKASMARPSSTVVPSSSTATSTVKGLPQQPGIRVRQPAISATNHSQISFSVNPKTVQPSQQFGANSPPSTVVGSPTARSGGGVSTSKPASVLGSGPASTSLPSQTTKNSSNSTRKSSPGNSSRNATSIPSSAHMAPSQNPSSKPLQQQLQQQQKAQPYQQQAQAQLFFSNPYMQSQSPQSTSSNSPSGHYQRKQQEQLSSPQNSTGMLSLSSSPLALPGGVTSDQTKAVAAAAAPNNIKGLAASGIIHPGQFQAQSAGGPHPYIPIPYLHTLPAVPVKSTDPKPATGNDSLRTSWQPEKR